MTKNLISSLILCILLIGCVSSNQQIPIQKVIKMDNCTNVYGTFEFNPAFVYMLNIKALNKKISGNYLIDDKFIEIKYENTDVLIIIHKRDNKDMAVIPKSRYTCEDGILLVNLPSKSDSDGGGTVYEWNRKMHVYSISENEVQAKVDSSTLGMFSLIPIYAGKSDTLQTLKRINY